jgi:hypothetical protein
MSKLIQQAQKYGYLLYSGKNRTFIDKLRSEYFLLCSQKNLPCVGIEKRINYAYIFINLDSVDYRFNPEEIQEIFAFLDRNCAPGKWEVYVEDWIAEANKIPLQKSVMVANKFLEFAFLASKRSPKINIKKTGKEQKEFNELQRKGASDSELFEYVLKFPQFSETWLQYYSDQSHRRLSYISYK